MVFFQNKTFGKNGGWAAGPGRPQGGIQLPIYPLLTTAPCPNLFLLLSFCLYINLGRWTRQKDQFYQTCALWAGELDPAK